MDLEEQIKVEITSIETLLNEKQVHRDKIKTIITILNNIGYQKIFMMKINLYNESYAKNILHNNRIILINKFINILTSTISQIKNEHVEEDIYVPQVWKIEQSYKKNLIEMMQKHSSFIDNYVSIKRKNNLNNIFENLNNIFENNINNIQNIIGEEHIINCKGKIDY